MALFTKNATGRPVQAVPLMKDNWSEMQKFLTRGNAKQFTLIESPAPQLIIQTNSGGSVTVNLTDWLVLGSDGTFSVLTDANRIATHTPIVS